MEYLAAEKGFPLERLPALRRELSPLHDAAAIRSLAGTIRRFDPQVVHTHTAKAGATGRIAALLDRRSKRVLVHSYHGHVLSGYFDPLRTAVFRTVERALATRTSALIAVSEQVRDDLVGMGVAPRERFAVIPYGFELSGLADPDGSARAEARARLGLADGTFLVGWAGRFTAIKRPAELVHTLAALRARGVDAALCLVGDGPDRPQTERLAATLDLSGSCHFPGYQRELRGWLAAFDAFCLSSANEGTPVAAIEALAAKRPVVSTRVGGTPAVIDEAETGFLVELGDPDGLAERLATLARDPALRRRMGALGAQRMGERYSTERMVGEIEALYRRFL